MTEVILVGVLVSLAIVSFLFHIIFIKLRKDKKFKKSSKNEEELMRLDKELDKKNAQKRGLHLLNIKNNRKTRSD